VITAFCQGEEIEYGTGRKKAPRSMLTPRAVSDPRVVQKWKRDFKDFGGGMLFTGKSSRKVRKNRVS